MLYEHSPRKDKKRFYWWDFFSSQPNQHQAAVVLHTRECAEYRDGSSKSFCTVSGLPSCMWWVFMYPKNNGSSDCSLNYSKGLIFLKEITKNLWLVFGFVAFVFRSIWTLFESSQYKLSGPYLSDPFRYALHRTNIWYGVVWLWCTFGQVADYHLLLLVVQEKNSEEKSFFP